MIDANESRMNFAKKYVKGVETYLPPKPEAGESKLDCKIILSFPRWKLMSIDSKRNAAQILGQFDWLSEGAHAVVDATGAEVCTQTAIYVTRKNGVFIQAGMGPNEIQVPIATICARELTVRMVLCSLHNFWLIISRYLGHSDTMKAAMNKR